MRYLLLCLFIVSTHTFASPIRIGYVEFPPFTYTDRDGVPTGSFIEAMKKTFKAAGIEWSAVSYPAKRLYTKLGRGDVDLFLGIDTSPLIQGQTFPGKVKIGTIVMNLYYRSRTSPISKIEDLKGKVVILVRGYSYGTWGKFIKNPKNGVRFFAAKSREDAFKMLIHNRADYLVDYENPASVAIKKYSINDVEKKRLFSLQCYYVLSRKTKNVDKIFKLIQKHHQK